jgi:hypothetical protein
MDRLARLTDGLEPAAARELELHPTRSDGKPITAWLRRAVTLRGHASAIIGLERRVSELETMLPFPVSSSPGG